MSFNKEKYARRNSPSDPNFNLDDYLEEKGNENFIEEELEEESPKRRNIKNGVILAIVLVAFVTWTNNLTRNADWLSFLGLGDDQDVVGTPVVVDIPPINFDIPDIDIPEINIDIPDIDFSSNQSNLGPVVEYLQELQNQGLLDEKISAFEARQVYQAGVPVNYLIELDQRGYLEELSFVEIGEFYKNNIPLEYLDQLDQLGYLERLSFVEIGEFYRNGVSFEYLANLDEAGYLDELSFVYITEYYKNGVTPEFLDELKATGLYNSLNFIDVVELYKNQN